MHEPPYFGNGPYCYANSLAMCLRARAPPALALPEPGFLECLTTMPFGVFCSDPETNPRLFFSPGSVTPDLGLERAMTALGWSWEIVRARTEEVAGRLLAESVRNGPALAGPLDMGELGYNPFHAHLAGVDHYVAVLGLEGDRVRLHDPEGFPQALLPLTEFLRAWRAERVGFPHQPFTLRRAFQPGPRRERAEMIARVLPLLDGNLRADPGGPEIYGGPDAIRRFVDAVRTGVPPATAAFQTTFAFPLGARRAADAAEFLREAGHPAPAALMREKARRLGGVQYAAVSGRWEEVGATLETVADLEGKILSHLAAH